MPTKAQLEEVNRQLSQELHAVRAEKRLLEQTLSSRVMACEIIKRDLQHNISFQSLYEEVASEQVERFERGITVAIRRLEKVCERNEDLRPIGWLDPLWQERTEE